MSNDNEKYKILTPVFRVNWPNVFKARASDDDKSYEKFSLVMMFRTSAVAGADPAHDVVDILDMKKMAAQVLNDKFGDRSKWPEGMNQVFRNGATKKHDGFDAGIEFINASSKFKPGLLTPQKEDLIDPNGFKAGDYARATVIPHWYDNKGNKGIAWWPINIIKIKDGELLQSGGNPQEDFDSIPVPAGPLGGAGGAPTADPLSAPAAVAPAGDPLGGVAPSATVAGGSGL